MKTTNSSIKTKLKPQIANDFDIGLPKTIFLEILGSSFILLSGLLPFVHIFVPDEPLEDKFFGFTSVHRFLYSAGSHSSLFFIVIGVGIIFGILNGENTTHVRKIIIYTLLSPFVSALFFLSWIFIPEVDYNSLAYGFIAFLIILISSGIMLKLVSFLKKVRKSTENHQRIINEMLKPEKTEAISKKKSA